MADGRPTNASLGLGQPYRDRLQPGNVFEVPRVRGQQSEVALDRLGSEPEIVDAEVCVASGFPQVGSQDPNTSPVYTVIRSCGLRRKRRSAAAAFCFCRPGRSMPRPNCTSATLTG